MEKVVPRRIDSHLDTHYLRDPLQPAYRTRHSTETALMKVHNYIVTALDQRSSAVLVLLDLSAAFDIIDHNILFQRLTVSFSLVIVLKWIESYLHDRRQCVTVGSIKSDSLQLSLGVLQGYAVSLICR